MSLQHTKYFFIIGLLGFVAGCDGTDGTPLSSASSGSSSSSSSGTGSSTGSGTTSGSGTSTGSGTGSSSSSTTLTVRVDGDHLIDASGKTLQLRGVNVSGLEFVAVQGWDPSDPWGGGAPDWNAIKTWKANAVRFPLNEASWLGYQCVDGNGNTRDPDPGKNYKTTVQTAVQQATAAGLYVILDLHWTAPKNYCPLGQNPMADADNSVTFWTSLATAYKGDPNVIFELFNEPYFYWLTANETEWNVLMKGGTITKYVSAGTNSYETTYSWQSAGMQQLVDAVRATGATNVVLVSGVSWSQDLSQWAANKPTDSANQLAAVWHAYPNSSTVGNAQAALPKYGSVAYTWTQSVLAAGYPVVTTEFGDNNATGTVGSPFASNLLPWLDKAGGSYLGWTWNAWSDSSDILILNDSGTPTDGYGVYVKTHYECVAAGTSNCL